MSTYDLVKELLEKHPKLRDSDNLLMWTVWHRLGLTSGDKGNYYITMKNFAKAPSTETIRRSRQKVQENHPELQASEPVKKMREDIENTKGDFVYMERSLF